MKQLFYFLFIFSLISCGGNDSLNEDVPQNNPSDLEPKKILTYLAEMPVSTNFNPDWYYEFFYENGRLRRMNGRLSKVDTGSSSFYFFYNDKQTNITYTANQATVQYDEPQNGIKKIVYSFQNSKLIKAEIYNTQDEIYRVKNYSYQNNKILIHTKWYTWDTYETYFFDANQNLEKSEKLDLSNSIETKLTTTYYMNFDQSENPYKKLYLMNDNFFVKSLSKNNYRKISYLVQDLQNPQWTPGSGQSEWTYQYSSTGQVILY